MPTQLNIRNASAFDAKKITSVINRAFSVVEQFFVDGDRITEDEVRADLRKGKFLLLEIAGEIEGCVYVEPNGSRAYLGLLSVAPGLQQKGTGSLLLKVAERHCRELGCEFMDIKVVNLRSELPAFYAKRGYVESGTSPFPPDIETKLPCHFIDMTKKL
ncbi:MAG TPA: GNAT family N-acetyltransferase [Pyrinomonadaceae bacterium]